MDNTMNMEAMNAREHGAEAAGVRPGTVARNTRSPQSLGGLLGAVWRSSTELLVQEAELAKAEASESVTRVVRSVGALAAGGAVMFGGFLILLMAAVNALAQYLPLAYTAWLAPLIVGLVAALIGYALFASGRKAMEAQNLKPTRTVDSMRRNTEMVKEHVQ